MTEEYKIECPTCKSTFDCTKDIEEWKKEIIKTLEVLKEINKLLEHEK